MNTSCQHHSTRTIPLPPPPPPPPPPSPPPHPLVPAFLFPQNQQVLELVPPQPVMRSPKSAFPNPPRDLLSDNRSGRFQLRKVSDRQLPPKLQPRESTVSRICDVSASCLE
nr:hypothetical transcript [Hymenolepis microstoma]